MTFEGMLKSNCYNILLFTGTAVKIISEHQPANTQTVRLNGWTCEESDGQELKTAHQPSD